MYSYSMLFHVVPRNLVGLVGKFRKKRFSIGVFKGSFEWMKFVDIINCVLIMSHQLIS